MSLVRRSAIQFVSALGVLVALAIFDLGPRADAAYRSVAVTAPASDDLGMSSADDAPVPPRELTPAGQKRILPPDALYVPGGGMAPPNSTTSTDAPPGAGCLPQSEPPAGGLVVYFREPAGSLHLSAFIDSLLDPPRPA